MKKVLVLALVLFVSSTLSYAAMAGVAASNTVSSAMIHIHDHEVMEEEGPLCGQCNYGSLNLVSVYVSSCWICKAAIYDTWYKCSHCGWGYQVYMGFCPNGH
jgi:hypothetical protein